VFLQHFGFQTAPFERDLSAEHFYNSPQFSEALARLEYACHKRTLAVITGEAGSGKSTLARALFHRLDPNAYLHLYIVDSHLTPRNFYFLALKELGINPPGQLPQLKSLFKKTALELFESKGKTLVLVLDEAQTLEASMLFELRFLLNYQQDSFSPLTVILIGETALKASLRAYHMSGIWRRVEISYHLNDMDFEQTKAYINHQLKTAGCSHFLFPDDVIARIQEKSRGLPAFINTLCRGCLLDAAHRKQELIDGENLNRVLSDIA